MTLGPPFVGSPRYRPRECRAGFSSSRQLCEPKFPHERRLRNRRVRALSAFSRFALVHSTDLEGRQGVEGGPLPSEQRRLKTADSVSTCRRFPSRRTRRYLLRPYTWTGGGSKRVGPAHASSRYRTIRSAAIFAMYPSARARSSHAPPRAPAVSPRVQRGAHGSAFMVVTRSRVGNLDPRTR
jgi:hypothetical protein